MPCHDAPLAFAADPNIRNEEGRVPEPFAYFGFPFEAATYQCSSVKDLGDTIAHIARQDLDAVDVGEVLRFREFLSARSPGDQREVVVEEVIEHLTVATLQSDDPLPLAGENLLMARGGNDVWFAHA